MNRCIIKLTVCKLGGGEGYNFTYKLTRNIINKHNYSKILAN